ncbi:Transposon Ty3-G Gag-Pol polyprotein [Sesamum angolense]|uniref:Transposon Ty3-G Gag-Pol polyprotein n=1 Tax=Sesamum angolense TaxID=2727404 RepID=A0AAE1WAN1_9LAMI|nr:Transposon Ty3-G Gag-Pol polyprotein [Sesamum angolense]
MDVRHNSTVTSLSALQCWSSSPPLSLVAPVPLPLPTDVVSKPQPLPSPPKIHLQLFDSSNPLDWLFHANQFFTYYVVLVELRLRCVSCYTTDDALAWYQWMHGFYRHGRNLCWLWSFALGLLRMRIIDRLCLNSVNLVLFSTTNVSSNIVVIVVVGLSPEMVLDSFLSGLSPNCQRELVILQQHSISQAIGLAKLLGSSLPRPSVPVPTTPLSVVPRSAPPALPKHPILPIKHLLPAEMQARRAKGLCFNCDEKFFVGHRCRPKQFLLLLADEDGSPASSASLNPLLAVISCTAPPLLLVSFLSQSSPAPSHFHLSSDVEPIPPFSVLVVHVVSMLPDEDTVATLPADLATLLRHFTAVFALPQGWSPHRSHDHRIHLVPNAISPYSSPVLLVKKKDGSWRFSTDYQDRNAITAKDYFSIPTIDELHGAGFFSNIDLRSGYHQICICPEDIPKTTFRSVDDQYEFVIIPFGLFLHPATSNYKDHFDYEIIYKFGKKILVADFLSQIPHTGQLLALSAYRRNLPLVTFATLLFQASRRPKAYGRVWVLAGLTSAMGFFITARNFSFPCCLLSSIRHP